MRPKKNVKKINALIVRAAGTNCDQETIHALEQAGATCDLAHINQLLLGRVRLHPYHILVFPGGFSYGDDISAGKVFAVQVRHKLKEQLHRFIESKKLVIGVCNGFQVLVKAGLLPGFDALDKDQSVTLGLNDSARFQCEWVGLKVEKSAATWLKDMPSKIELPIAHAEGKFITAGPKILQELKKNNQVVFRYTPTNPNGSDDAIAGICNKTGTVVGLMPHPERFLTKYEHPNWPARHNQEAMTDIGDGFYFWKQAVLYAKEHLN